MERLRLNVKDLPKPLTPRQFCQAYFGLEGLPPEEMAEAETESGYRKKCVKLLAKVLNMTERSVRYWGPGLNFEKMPEHYKASLGYALSEMRNAAKRQSA